MILSLWRRAHKCVTSPANIQSRALVLLKIKRLNILMNLNAFTIQKVLVHETGNDLALSVQSQVKLVKLVYIV